MQLLKFNKLLYIIVHTYYSEVNIKLKGGQNLPIHFVVDKGSMSNQADILEHIYLNKA